MLDIAVAIVERDGHILFLQRERPPLRGLWELPGGKIHAGEDPALCAARELAEETGLRALASARLGAVAHSYPWGDVRLHAFAITAAGEARAGAWRPEAAWAADDVLPATRSLVQTLLRGRLRTPGSDKPS